MLLLPILFIGIFLYLQEKKVASAVIFFFFLSDGFQMIPPELFNTHLGFDKPTDFCFIYVVVLFLTGLLKYKDFIPKHDSIGKGIFIFLSAIVLIMGVNWFVLNVPIKEIIQTGRFFFILLAYFLFIRLTRVEVDKIHRILFPIVILQSLIFILQVIISEPLLTGYSGMLTMGLPFLRFYNLPLLIYFYVFYSLFQNPYTGWKKIASNLILSVTLLLPMHRGLIASFFITIIVASYLQGGLKSIAKYLLIAGIVIFPLMSILASRFEKGNTENDVENVMVGAFKDYAQNNDEMFVDGTFLFRIAHLYERFVYCQENPWNMAFGVGFMVEGSHYTENHLDFKIGLYNEDEGTIAQVDTSDIAWSNFVIRFGVVGTIAFFFFYGFLFFFFLRNRSINDAIPALMYLLLLLITSISSSQLYTVWMYSILFLATSAVRTKKEEQNNELGNEDSNKELIIS